MTADLVLLLSRSDNTMSISATTMCSVPVIFLPMYCFGSMFNMTSVIMMSLMNPSNNLLKSLVQGRVLLAGGQGRVDDVGEGRHQLDHHLLPQLGGYVNGQGALAARHLLHLGVHLMLLYLGGGKVGR